MKRKLLEILACPIDKYHPLKITEGALYCQQCSRFFPILDEIPIMLPDELRDKKQDIEFLKRNIKELPEKIVTQALPWHL